MSGHKYAYSQRLTQTAIQAGTASKVIQDQKNSLEGYYWISSRRYLKTERQESP